MSCLSRPSNRPFAHAPALRPRRLTLLPFSLWESCGLAMIPVAALVAFLLLGVEEIGVQIEEVSHTPKLPCTAVELGIFIHHCLRTCSCVAFPSL